MFCGRDSLRSKRLRAGSLIRRKSKQRENKIGVLEAQSIQISELSGSNSTSSTDKSSWSEDEGFDVPIPTEVVLRRYHKTMKAEKRQRLYVTIIRNLCDKNKRTVCRALRTLVTIYDGKDCGHFIQIGGHLAVIQAMESRNDARVQRSGCMAIISLSQNKQLKDKIIEDGGIGTITAGMEEFAHNKSVQMCSCGALTALAYKSETRYCPFFKAAAISSIVKAMESWPNDANVQFYACDALASLSLLDDGTRAAVADAGGLSSVAQALENHSQDERIRERALGCSLFDSWLDYKLWSALTDASCTYTGTHFPTFDGSYLCFDF